MRLLILPILAVMAALTGCSAAAPQAPLGFDRHPANSPDTVASLTRPPAVPKAETVAPNEASTKPLADTPRSAPPGPHNDAIVFSDQSAPRGLESLSSTDRDEMVAAARAASSVRILCRGDRDRPSRQVRARLVKRGAVFRQFLIDQGVMPEKIHIYVRSAGAFVADNSTSAGRAQNRRVEIQFAQVSHG